MDSSPREHTVRKTQDLNAAQALLELSRHAVIFRKPAPLTLVPGPSELFVYDGRKRNEYFHWGVVSLREVKRHQCSECGKWFASLPTLSLHNQTHLSIGSIHVKRCAECGKAYKTTRALAMHVLTHKPSHECYVCGRLFSRQWLLRTHLRCHTGEKPYMCAYCGEAFGHRSTAHIHMKAYSSHNLYQCTRCCQTFILKRYLNKHQKSVCVGEEDSSSDE